MVTRLMHASRPTQSKYITLKSLRNLRSWFKDANAQDVQDVIKQLEHLKREKSKEEELNLRNLRHQQMCAHYALPGSLASLSSNLEPQEVLEALTETLSCRLRRYRCARVKYRYHDLEGNLCEWSGQGREPIKLRQLLAATGKKREDFLVKDECEQGSFFSNEALLKLNESIDSKQTALILNNPINSTLAE